MGTVREQSTIAWLEEILPGQVQDAPLQEQLKTGVVLCNLLNTLKPGCCKMPSSSSVRAPATRTQQRPTRAAPFAHRTLALTDLVQAAREHP